MEHNALGVPKVQSECSKKASKMSKGFENGCQRGVRYSDQVFELGSFPSRSATQSFKRQVSGRNRNLVWIPHKSVVPFFPKKRTLPSLSRIRPTLVFPDLVPHVLQVTRASQNRRPLCSFRCRRLRRPVEVSARCTKVSFRGPQRSCCVCFHWALLEGDASQGLANAWQASAEPAPAFASVGL